MSRWIFVKQSASLWTPASYWGGNLRSHWDFQTLSGYSDGDLLSLGLNSQTTDVPTVPSAIALSTDVLYPYKANSVWPDTISYSSTAVNGYPGIGPDSRQNNSRGPLFFIRDGGTTPSKWAAPYGRQDVIVGLVLNQGNPGTTYSSCIMSQMLGAITATREVCGIYRETSGAITLKSRRLTSESEVSIASTATVAVGSTAIIVARLRFAGGDFELRINGSAEASGTYATSGASQSEPSANITNYNTFCGNGNQDKSWLGKMGEIVAAANDSAVFPSGDVEKLEGYLAHKWGLAANLPADHPYKSAAPIVVAGRVTASGGSETDLNGYRYHTFTSNGSLTVNTGGEVEYLIVGGGGAGGSINRAGGGGAGAALTGTAIVTAQTYSITIGAGGVSSNGGDSSALGFTATGGGKGGTGTGSGASAASSGGSGGGGGSQSVGASGTTGGNNGGDGGGISSGEYNSGAGGGGGAGSAGSDGISLSDGGDGGAGIEWPTGSGTYYAGGGGGSSVSAKGGDGGAGGGGGGGTSSGTIGVGGSNGGAAAVANNGGDGGANTGGGGGGSVFNNGVSGDGGSGIVIVRYTI